MSTGRAAKIAALALTLAGCATHGAGPGDSPWYERLSTERSRPVPGGDDGFIPAAGPKVAETGPMQIGPKWDDPQIPATDPAAVAVRPGPAAVKGKSAWDAK